MNRSGVRFPQVAPFLAEREATAKIRDFSQSPHVRRIQIVQEFIHEGDDFAEVGLQ